MSRTDDYIDALLDQHDDLLAALEEARLALALITFRDRTPIEWPHVERVEQAIEHADQAIEKAGA